MNSRVLDSWRDNTSALFDAHRLYLEDQISAVDESSPYTAEPPDLVTRRCDFDTALRNLHEQGVAYDPRDTGAQIPAEGAGGSLARDARIRWTNLRARERDYHGWVKIMKDTHKTRLTRELQQVMIARNRHFAFIAQVYHHALRWRVIGKTALLSVRWMRRAFGKSKLARMIVREALQWPFAATVVLMGLRWMRTAKRRWIVA